jgi:cytochrome b
MQQEGNRDHGVARRKSMPAVRIWDLPTRLFHWVLLALVITSVVTAKLGGNAMEWHMRSGYAVLTLVLFRILWGFAGARYARFASFVRGPRTALRYARDVMNRSDRRYAGHNPLGSWSILAMLGTLTLQGLCGLFANDDIVTQGPLARFVSDRTSQLLTRIHNINEIALYALIALHLCAIAFFFITRRENLVAAMVTGDKFDHAVTPADDGFALRLRALILLALSCGLVGYVVTL